MGIFKLPVGKELQRRFKLLSHELSLLGMSSLNSSVENLKSQYTAKGYSQKEVSENSNNKAEGIIHELILSDLDVEVFPINSLIEFDPIALGLVLNKITDLPKEIGNFNSIKKLYIGFNNISALPDTIGNLETLEEFSISNNKVQSLPPSFSKLKNL